MTKEMRPYRLKHKPTGLYYKPSCATNLTSKGKVYTTSGCALSYYDKEIKVSIQRYSTTYKKFSELLEPYRSKTCKLYEDIYDIPRTHFELEEL